MWASPTPFVPLAIPADPERSRQDADAERCECRRVTVVPGVGMWCPDCHNIRHDRLLVDTREPAFSEDRGAGPPPAKRCYLRQGGKRQAQQRQTQLTANSNESAGAGRAPRGAKRARATSAGTKRARSPAPAAVKGEDGCAPAPKRARKDRVREQRAPRPPKVKEPPKPREKRERKPRTRAPRVRQPQERKPRERKREAPRKRERSRAVQEGALARAPKAPPAAGSGAGTGADGHAKSAKGVAEASAGLTPEAVLDAERMYSTFREHPRLASASRKKLRGVLLACLYRAAIGSGCGFNLTAARRALGVSSHSVNEANLALCEIGQGSGSGPSEDATLAALVRAAVQRLTGTGTGRTTTTPPDGPAAADEKQKRAGIDTEHLVECAQFARRSCPELNSAHARSVCAATLWVFATPGDVTERAVCDAAEVSPDTLKRYARFLAAAIPGRARVAARLGTTVSVTA